MMFSRFRRPVLLVAALGGSIVLAGCSVSSSSSPAEGTVTVDFDVDEGQDPADCDANGAVSLDLDVTDSHGVVRTFTVPCDRFTITVALAPGFYTADATLVDGSDNARTSTAPIDTFQIISNTDVNVALVDFQQSSFL